LHSSFSARDVESLLTERGVEVLSGTIWRWRAVAQDGVVRDTLVPSRRTTKDATRVFTARC